MRRSNASANKVTALPSPAVAFCSGWHVACGNITAAAKRHSRAEEASDRMADYRSNLLTVHALLAKTLHMLAWPTCKQHEPTWFRQNVNHGHVVISECAILAAQDLAQKFNGAKVLINMLVFATSVLVSMVPMSFDTLTKRDRMAGRCLPFCLELHMLSCT